MIYLTSLTMIVLLLLLVTTIGRHIINLLPISLRKSVGFYLSPLLGLAGVLPIVTMYGWITHFQTSISLALFLVLILLGIKLEKQRDELFRDWLTISAFAIIVTIPILAPVLRFDSFNPFNDTFTYLEHGQWLQNHAFSELARASGYFPAETQVILYQKSGSRMGGSFFLAFVQSLFNLRWSYYAFPATVGLVFAVGCLAVGSMIQQVIPVSRTITLALSTLPAFSMNGFVFGAQFGFFPQTFGISFAAGLSSLISGLTAHTLIVKPDWKKQFIFLLPAALCCAALLFTYNDMFSPVGAGICLFMLLMCWIYRNELNRILILIFIMVAEVMAIVNIEGLRILRNFIHIILGVLSGEVPIGWPVLWAPIQFVALSFGMKSPFDSKTFFIDRLFSIWIFPILLTVIILILLKILREKPKNIMIILIICLNIVFWLAFLKFRYINQNNNGEIGSTFLQFKLAKWLSPYNLGLLGIAMAWIFTNIKKYKIIYKLIFSTAFIAGMAIQFVIVAQMFTTQFQDEAMKKHSPFNVFLDLRSRVANIPKDQVIYLGIPPQHDKVTQMVAYILQDRKLAGRYEDGYIRGSLPEMERDMPIDKSDWLIQYNPARNIDENPLDRVGPFLIHQAPYSFYKLNSIINTYSTEVGKGNFWNWVRNKIEYRFTHVGSVPKIKVRFQYLLSGKPRMLTLELNDVTGKRIDTYKIPLNGGWGEYESPIIDIKSGDFVIDMKADGEAVRLSSSDTRKTKFLVQNLSIINVALTSQ